MFYVGVDGGGTKTLFRIVDEQGKKIQEYSFPTSHFGQVGYDGLAFVLQQGYGLVTELVGKDVFFSCGLAGYGEVQTVRSKIESVVTEIFGSGNFLLHNDAQIGVYGALGGKDGIVMIAGTGSIAMAYKGGQWHRKGGWGYLIDDGGSAYDIGRHTLRMFARMAEDLEEKDALFHVIMARYRLEKPMDLIPLFFEKSNHIRNAVAEVASLLSEAYDKGSIAAKNIYDTASQQHVVFINGLRYLFPQTCTISYIGGVFKAGDAILKPLQSHGVDMVPPIMDPCDGAILLAKKL